MFEFILASALGDLEPYIPTIVLALVSLFLVGADLIKGRNVYREEKKRKEKAVIDEYQKGCDIQEEFKSLHDRFDDLDKRLIAMEGKISSAESRLDDLTSSDMHDIKCWIVDQYQKYYVEQGWIDAFHADTIDRRYEDYLKEGGNSYIETLMNRLHTLPMDPPEDKKGGQKNESDGTSNSN